MKSNKDDKILISLVLISTSVPFIRLLNLGMEHHIQISNKKINESNPKKGNQDRTSTLEATTCMNYYSPPNLTGFT